MIGNVRSLHGLSRRRSGFTILEILIVLAVIGMLVALGVTQADRILGRSQESVARTFVNQSMKAPLVAYRVDMGSYPSTAEGLQALVTPPSTGRADRWRGPYIDAVPIDPWGNPYQYRFPGVRNPGGYDLFSWGPDGRESDDDIGNWQ